MNVRQLEVFRAVVASGGVANAADSLGVSQPAVSRMIKHTEASLGFQLFERLGGRLCPTDEAQRLYEEINPLFASIKAVQDRIHDIRDAKAGSLRIVATPGLAHSIVPQALESFLRERPKVQVTLDIRRRENVVQHTQANTADVGLALTPAETPDLALRPIKMGRMVCIVPEAHPLTDLDVVTPKDLRAYPFIMMTRGSPLGNLIAAAFEAAGEDIAWSIETRYTAVASTLVKKGFGVALVDEYVESQGNFQGLTVKPFDPAIQITAYLFYSKLKPLSKLTKLFIRSVMETQSQKTPASL